MDVGDSMNYHTRICEQLFSAAHQSAHLKEFQRYYFHNCPYDFLFEDIEQEERTLSKDLPHKLNSSWMMMCVGDDR